MEIQNDFEAIYDMYSDMIYKIAYLYLGSTDDTEDVLQDIFIKLLTSTKKFNSEEHRRAWLIRATQNRCKDMLRSSSRANLNIEDYQLPATSKDSDKALDITSKIIALPPKYKTVIILFYYYDYSVSHIATTLKISTSSVKMRLKRGREILKIELEDYSNE